MYRRVTFLILCFSVCFGCSPDKKRKLPSTAVNEGKTINQQSDGDASRPINESSDPDKDDNIVEKPPVDFGLFIVEGLPDQSYFGEQLTLVFTLVEGASVDAVSYKIANDEAGCLEDTGYSTKSDLQTPLVINIADRVGPITACFVANSSGQRAPLDASLKHSWKQGLYKIVGTTLASNCFPVGAESYRKVLSITESESGEIQVAMKNDLYDTSANCEGGSFALDYTIKSATLNPSNLQVIAASALDPEVDQEYLFEPVVNNNGDFSTMVMVKGQANELDVPFGIFQD